MAHVAVPVSAAYKGPNKKDKQAIAKAATARKMENAGTAKGGPRGGAPYELPNGQCGAPRALATSRTTISTREALLQRPTLGRTAARQ
eukprot:1049500-Pleurochrysis_carterae.AAC.1